MRRALRVLLAATLALNLAPRLGAETEQPPFEVKDPAISDNFREIYYAADRLSANILDLETSAATIAASLTAVAASTTSLTSDVAALSVSTTSLTANVAALSVSTASLASTKAPIASPTFTGTVNAGVTFITAAGAQAVKISDASTYTMSIGTFVGDTASISVAGSASIALGTNSLNRLTINSSGAATFTGAVDAQGTLKGKGTATNDNAATGYIGEYLESKNSSATNFPTTNVYGDAGSLTLTAGDWDVTFQMRYFGNGATWTQAIGGISSTSGNSNSGLLNGDNLLLHGWASSSTTPESGSITIASFRVSLASTTTYYGKVRALYTAGGPPLYFYRLSARRVR